ncbi:carbon-nitrogen hydrolase family protein [Acidisoma silvae]|uniref:Carbon-nitrogen hydrolase family protein n=1 Tax=Acidisoma silvae TaxID=2802396 RepID=A0A963YVM9_9PROT|nr:carbon-nitrogen hydrolase family protein [Acidisoma silvae]MCB8877978.1 carbon-nitrogen hydrolase family protein [Acidisoma silvae]
MMRFSALQMQPASCDKQANIERIKQAAAAARQVGSGLLVAPEMSITGYAIWDQLSQMAEPRDGFMTQSLTAMARALNIAIVAGMPERAGQDIYNTAVCALPSGQLHFYRKCHLFGPDEIRGFRAGEALSPTFEIDGVKAGMLVCYDVEFPEWARALALTGAQLFIVPTALPKVITNDRVSRLMIPARALENHVMVIYAGLCGSENGLDYQGGSCIVGSDGADLARAGKGEALLTADIGSKVPGAEHGDPYLHDRRPALYRSLSLA